MADEVETTEADKQEQLDMLAAFEGKAPPEETVAEPVVAAEDPASEEETPAAETPPAEPQPEYVQLTKEEREELRQTRALVASLQQQVHRAAGVAGDVQEQFKRMRENAVQGIPVSEEHFAELKAEFGPEVAKALVTGLQRTLKTAPGAAPIQQSVDPNVVREHVRVQNNAVELERLNEAYPAWQEITDRRGVDPGNRYRAWLKQQPADYQERMNRTASGLMLMRSLDRFLVDEERAAARQTASPAPPKPPAQRAFRTAVRPNRLRAAVTPNGDARASAQLPDESTDFHSGFYGKT